MTTPFLPGVIVLPAWNDVRVGVAKRARDEDLLVLRDEADACGWCSSVPDRSLALRRRRAPASCSSPKGCGWLVAAATTEEHDCRREEAAAVGSGSADEETAIVEPGFLPSSSNSDSDAFDTPPMATPLLPLCSFIRDLFKARNDKDLLDLSEEAGFCGWSSEVPERRLAPHRVQLLSAGNL